MANSPDIFVARKILSSKYLPYDCGKIFRAPRSQPNFPISGWTLNKFFCQITRSHLASSANISSTAGRSAWIAAYISGVAAAWAA